MSADAVDYRALAEFRYRLRCFIRFSEDAAHAAGLDPGQHQFLLALKGLPEGVEPTITELAGRVQVRHHSAVELVDRLAERGFVRRRRAESDRRKVLIEITPEGNRVLRNLSVQHRAELQSAGPALVSALQALLN